MDSPNEPQTPQPQPEFDPDQPRRPNQIKYPPELIIRLKRDGKPKPHDCPQNDWDSPNQGLTARQKLISYFAAQGMKNDEIASELDISSAQVSKTINNTQVKKYISQLQYKMIGKPAEERFREILPKAITTAEEIMDDDQVKATTRADVAFKFMDRALGKPVQQHEIGGSLIRDIWARLDSLSNQPKTIEIEQSPKEDIEDAILVDSSDNDTYGKEQTTSNDDPDDEIDAFITKNFGRK